MSNVTMSVHDIGRASDPTATVRTVHVNVDAARSWLVDRYGADHIRGGITSGTVVTMCGTVAQASLVWSIER